MEREHLRNLARIARNIAVGIGVILAVVIAVYFASDSTRDFVDRQIQSGLTRRATLAEDALQQELLRYRAAAEDLAASPTALATLESTDRAEADALLESDRARVNVDMTLVIDAQGKVRAGTPPFSERGDYRPYLTEWSNTVFTQEQTVSTIGRDRFLPLLLIGGAPIYAADGSFAGAAFTAAKLDDAFARAFAPTVFSAGTHLAFYAEDGSLTGSSFPDAADRQLLDTYFHAGSNLFDPASSMTTLGRVAIGGNDYFVVRNRFPAGEEGGMLIFFPYHPVGIGLTAAAIITAVFLLLVFASLFATRRRGRGAILVSILVGLVLFLAAGFYASRVASGVLFRLGRNPYLIYNATLELEPGYDAFDLHASHRIAVVMHTGGEAVNAAGVTLAFDPDAIEVEQILTENSFCTLFVHQTIDNVNGRVHVECGLPSPGYIRPKGDVFEFIVRPKRLGTFSIKFTDDTSVLANDGFGTNVLRATTNSGYTSVEDEAFLFPERTGVVPLFSPTHPNPERWYRQNRVLFTWPAQAGREYVYAFDDNANTVPDGSHRTTESSLDFSAVPDGVHYLHLAAAEGGALGPISHYRVMVDRTPPSPPAIRASATDIHVGDVVRLAFESHDAESGMQKNFYVDFGNHLFLPIASPFYLPFVEPGTRTITVRAFDNAGNASDAAVTIHVRNNIWSALFPGLTN